MLKKAVYMALGIFTINGVLVSSMYAANDDVLDLGDNVDITTSDNGTGTDAGLDIGTGDTNTATTDNTNNTNTDATTTDNTNDNVDIQNDNTNDAVGDNTTIDETQNTVEVKYIKKGNGYVFNMPIPDPTVSYGVKFMTTDKDITISDVVIEKDKISDNLKKAFSIVIINDNGKKTYSLSDLETKPILVPQQSDVYLIYIPTDGTADEIQLLNNDLKVYMKEATQPEIWGEVVYNNGNLELQNSVEYVEDVEQESDLSNYTPTENKKQKKEISKVDTGPQEYLMLLSFVLVSLVFLIVGMSKYRIEE